jgi:hypothetical protein
MFGTVLIMRATASPSIPGKLFVSNQSRMTCMYLSSMKIKSKCTSPITILTTSDPSATVTQLGNVKTIQIHSLNKW